MLFSLKEKFLCFMIALSLLILSFLYIVETNAYSINHINSQSNTFSFAGMSICIKGSCDVVDDSYIQNINYYHQYTKGNALYYFSQLNINITSQNSSYIRVESHPVLLRQRTNELIGSETLSLVMCA